MRIFINELRNHVGETVTIKGWVTVRRDQGKLVFFDVRDMTGTVQGVVLPKSAAITIAKDVSRESAVSITGILNKRPEKNMDADKENGDIELAIDAIEVLGAAKTLPYEISEDTSGVAEEVRLEYRYLDLRSERMQRNIRMRSEFVRRVREHLFAQKFTEIETPLLTESTPEGSRDFVVPARLHPGKFYALPQSPQQYKQLLMVGGFERYFQIARCVRDEDLRADRGFEFTQVDIEMSFVEMENVMNTIENMMISVAEGMGKVIKQKPFPRFTYAEAMEKFGADKFDLRTDDEKKDGKTLAYAWVYKFPFFEKAEGGGWTFTHNPFSAPIPEHVEWLKKGENIEQIITQQYDLVCNGYETAGGSIRAHDPEVLRSTYKVMGMPDEQINERIGHMLNAFEYGTPPHGGIAFGVERAVMNLTGETYLREVQAFPMTRGGKTAVMSAPKPLTVKQLMELGISVNQKKLPDA